MNEKRNLQSIRMFGLTIIGILILSNILYYFQYYLNITLFSGELTPEVATNFGIFSCLFLYVCFMFSSVNIVNENAQKELDSKMLPYKIPFVILFLYIIFTFIYIDYSAITYSAITMVIIYIPIYKFTKCILSFDSYDYQRRWREAVNPNYKEREKSTFLWRFKIWAYPKEHVPFNKRFMTPYRLFFGFLIFTFIYSNFSNRFSIFAIPFLFITIRDILSILEGFLGLHTSFVGECTGILQKHVSKSSNNYYYTIYITDYETKKEIVYSVYYNPYVREGEKVKVTHGIFSKRTVLVNDIALDFKY